MLKRFLYKKLDDQQLDDRQLDDRQLDDRQLDDTGSYEVTELQHRSGRDDLKIRPLTDHPDLRRALGLDRADPVDHTRHDLADQLVDRFDLRRLIDAA